MKKKVSRSLVDFTMDKKRKACAVCNLSPAIQAQLVEARTHKIRLAEQLEWLASEHGINLTRAHFDAHWSGRHTQ